MHIDHYVMMISKYENARPYVLRAIGSLVSSSFYITYANKASKRAREREGGEEEKLTRRILLLTNTLLSARTRNDFDRDR